MKNHVAVFTKDHDAGAPATRGDGAPRRGCGLLAAVPGVGAALLLGAACPACWLYAGLAVLVGASLWNAWPRQTAITEACAACAPHASAGEHVSAHKEITP